MNHVFFDIMYEAWCILRYIAEITNGGMMFWTLFFWDTLGPAFHPKVLQGTVAHHLHPLMETVFSNGTGFFQKDNTQHCKNGSEMV